jgi:hypothetical protein
MDSNIISGLIGAAGSIIAAIISVKMSSASRREKLKKSDDNSVHRGDLLSELKLDNKQNNKSNHSIPDHPNICIFILYCLLVANSFGALIGL